MCRERTPRYKTLDWLRNHGCAYDSVEQMAMEQDTVDIWIDSTQLASWLFRITAGQPAFYLWAQFSARKAAVYMKEVWFELRDAPDIQFELLPCPVPKREPYRFPDGGFDIPQEQVLNAFFPGTLYRHHPIEGCVMGVAYQSLPDRLFGKLAAELSVSMSSARWPVWRSSIFRWIPRSTENGISGEKARVCTSLSTMTKNRSSPKYSHRRSPLCFAGQRFWSPLRPLVGEVKAVQEK